jgi:hypothetical protein
VVAYLLLGIGQAVGLVVTALGWPGLWVQLASLALFGWWSGFEVVAVIPLVLLVAMAVIAESFEAVLTGGRADRSRRRRSGITALAGGTAGAALGASFPLVGSLFGAVGGAFVGSLIGATASRARYPTFSALAGESIAMAVKTAAALVVAVFAILTLMR